MEQKKEEKLKLESQLEHIRANNAKLKKRIQDLEVKKIELIESVSKTSSILDKTLEISNQWNRSEPKQWLKEQINV